MADPFTRFTNGWCRRDFHSAWRVEMRSKSWRPELLARPTRPHSHARAKGIADMSPRPAGIVVYELLRKWRNTPTLKSQTPRF